MQETHTINFYLLYCAVELVVCQPYLRLVVESKITGLESKLLIDGCINLVSESDNTSVVKLNIEGLWV